MHSFDDTYDYQGFRRLQFPSNNASPPFSDDFSALRSSPRFSINEDWLDSFDRDPVPLLLKESVNSIQDSDFQSNRRDSAIPFSMLSEMKNGLRFRLCSISENSCFSSNEHTPGSCALPEPLDIISYEDNHRLSHCDSDMQMNTGIINLGEDASSSARGGFQNGIFCHTSTSLRSSDSDDQCFSEGLSRLLSSLADSGTTFGMNPLSSSSGLLADINMFRSLETTSGPCIRPRDLVNNEITEGTEPLKGESKEVHSPENPLIAPASALKKHSEYMPETTLMATHSHSGLKLSDMMCGSTQYMPRTIEMETISPNLTSDYTLSLTSGPEISQSFRGMEMSGPLHAHKYSCKEVPSESSTTFGLETNELAGIGKARTLVNILDTRNDSQIPFDVILTDAHEGVSAEVVAQKTRYFMMTHPGERLSDELLFTFAGRLSIRGDIIQGYRCYVSGCGKTTKRKDHMGDHIRTHLGEKPFRCNICGLGFIRNNDCQRHENNHRPDKKFICDCHAAFSRRDLFVRHQKTACLLNSIDNPTAGTRRPKKYLRTLMRELSVGDDANDLDYNPRSGFYRT